METDSSFSEYLTCQIRSLADIVKYAKYVHKMGGVNTVCMHRKNPEDPENLDFNDPTEVIAKLVFTEL